MFEQPAPKPQRSAFLGAAASRLRISLSLFCLALLAAGCSDAPREGSRASSAPPESQESLRPGSARGNPSHETLGLDVQVTGGAIRGTGDTSPGGLKEYHGIPFAAPPEGDLRWAPPAPVVPWEGVRDASAPGPACTQRRPQSVPFYAAHQAKTPQQQSEDCLTLNVWTTGDRRDEGRPVMVWIHGGGLVGSAGSMHSGHQLAGKGAVFVTFNYRLGQLGFFAHPELTAESPKGVSGNQGFRDQIQALEWVRDNIADFGGDPDNVTILGESSGGTSVAVLQASPLARGLFHRAIGQSGAPFHPMRDRTRDQSFAPSGESNGLRFGAALVGEGGDQSLAALRDVPAERILEVAQSSRDFSVYEYLPMVDGDVLLQDVATTFASGNQADVPTMVGSTSDESSAPVEHLATVMAPGIRGFSMFAASMLPEVREEVASHYPAATDEQATRAWQDLLNDLNFNYPMRAWARGMTNVESDAYLYWFSWRPPIPNADYYGAFHGSFQMYLMGDLEGFQAVPTDADREFSSMLAATWVRFARTGDPNGGPLPEWPAFNLEDEPYMELGPTLAVGKHLRSQQMEVIAKAWERRRAAASGEDEGGFRADERLW